MTRRVVDTATGRSRWLPASSETVEFLGNYRGTLAAAPTGILAFVLTRRKVWAVSVEWETRGEAS